MVTDNLAQRTFEPRLVGLIDEAKDLIAVEIGDQERKGVGERAQSPLAFLHGFFGMLPVGDVQMHADKLQGPTLNVALDLRDRTDPADLPVAGANYAIFGLIVRVGACDRGQKVRLNPFSIVRMNTRDPLLVQVVDEVRRKAMKVKIFWRAWTAKAVGQIHFQSADAANTLNPGKLQFSATQRLRGPLAIRDVAKRHPDAIAKRKSPHFVSAIGAQRRIAFEFLSRSLLHDAPTNSVEFRPLNLGRNLPKQPANDFGGRYAEDRLRCAIEGGDAPVTIKRKETLAHPFEERLNERVLIRVARFRAYSSIQRAVILHAAILSPFYTLRFGWITSIG